MMTKLKLIAALGVIAALSACNTSTTQTGQATGASPAMSGSETAPRVRRDYTITDVRVVVPRDLKVSEANAYYPVADIVWRGDPYGDRYEQVKAIFETGMTRGASTFKGSRKVVVDIQVARFHSLTEKTRYSVGGVHSIRYFITVRDAKTGAVIEPTRLVKADLEGYGGERAIEAEKQGQTMKVRITDHLTREIERQLSSPAA